MNSSGSRDEAKEGQLWHYRRLLNENLKLFFKDAVRITVSKPSQAYFFYKTVRWQQKAARLRAQWQRRGVSVPPILIFSVTTRCNLQCEACYAQALHPPSNSEMTEGEIRRMMHEAKELGISFFVLAGGEPLIRPEILHITEDYPEILFLMFTNGLLIDEPVLERLSHQKNLIPLVSLEGYARDTDERRGKGVYDRLQRIIRKLKSKSIFFGTSLTITRDTFNTLTDVGFVGGLAGLGCRFFLYLEYTPIIEGTEDWVLTPDQRNRLMDLMHRFHSEYAALFIAVPGHEAEVGGCLAAGRGFIHVTAEGDVEPCPFAPFSDTNVREVSLKNALQSRLLEVLRQHPEQLQISEGGCCLWRRRTWVQSLLEGVRERQKDAS